MNAKVKSNSIVTHELLEGGIIRFTVVGVGSFDFDPRLAHTTNRERAEAHGWVQRISDRAAMSRDPKTGIAATAQEKHDGMKSLADHYASGAEAWSTSRGPSAPRQIPAILAVAQLRGITYAEAEVIVVNKALEELSAG